MKEGEKIYTTSPTKGKDGITRPVTRVHLEKPCPQCHQPMKIEKEIKGGVYKRSFSRWRCQDKTCNHSEMNEGDLDKFIRH